MIFKILFWISLFIQIFNYLLYPLILWVYTLLFPPKRRFNFVEYFQPNVSLIISAYNEENVIEKKIQNSVSLEYPKTKLEIIVVSDASTDKTDEIVKRWAEKDKRIKLLRQDKRQGKSIGLNKAAELAKGDILVFSDANSIYEKNAILELIKYFTDAQIGYAVGKALYYSEPDNPATSNEKLFWNYEILVKSLESKFHTVSVGDGAIYAIRRSLYTSIEKDDIGDFVHPLLIVAKGYTGIFAPMAYCYEEAAGDFKKEFYRKRRIVNRSWRALKKYYKLFNFKQHSKFIFELISHKMLRWFNWLFALILFFSNLIIILKEPYLFYSIFFCFQFIFCILGLIGFLLRKKSAKLTSLISFPYYYILMNLAAFLGIVDEMRGVKYVTWDHVRKK